MVEILRSRDQTGPLWWRFSSAIVALYSLTLKFMRSQCCGQEIPHRAVEFEASEENRIVNESF